MAETIYTYLRDEKAVVNILTEEKVMAADERRLVIVSESTSDFS
ncbi:MAG: hypothetical protein ACLTSM_08730 [Eubacterium sp.]